MTQISFVSDGDTISGNLIIAARPARLAFLFIQGWTGHQNIAAAQALADLGFTCMTYDMRGNGLSGGNLGAFSREDFLRDAELAYDFLRQHVGGKTAIGVVGSSFGGYTATLLSTRRPVACLSLRVPANYPDEGFDQPQLALKNASQDFREWRKRAADYTQNRALQALHDFAGPIQIIQAGADQEIPAQTIDNYVNAVASKAQLSHAVMKDAPHTLADEQLRAVYQTLLTNWAKQL